MVRRAQTIKKRRIDRTIHRWYPYDPEGHPPQVPLKDWGSDHWTTFAYLVTCVTGRDGEIENVKMRCNPRLHREFAHHMSYGGEYPTKTKRGDVAKHDDWSCLEDMACMGLIKAYFRIKKATAIFGGSAAKVELTDYGWRMARAIAEYRQTKGEGASMHEFVPPPDLATPPPIPVEEGTPAYV